MQIHPPLSVIQKLGVATIISLGLFTGTCRAQQLLVERGNTIAFLGDSITQQGGNDPGGYVNLVLAGLEANGLKVEAVKAGISGHKSNQMLDRVDGDVISKNPAIMTLSCGVNDVWHGEKGVSLDDYKKNITALVDKVQAAKVKVVILTSTLIGNADSEPSVKLDAYNAFLRALAKERNLPLADLNADMKKIMEEKGPRASLTTDGVHMAIKGNEMMAAGVLRALGLTPEQMNVAHAAWLDLPDTCPVPLKLTLRQFNKMAALAGTSKDAPPVYQFITDQFSQFVDTKDVKDDPASVSVAGRLVNTAGQPMINATAPAGKPAATLDWVGTDKLVQKEIGTHGYVLFRHNGTNPVPIRRIDSPFMDTFTGPDGFWYGDASSNMQFDLQLADGTVQSGRSAEGKVFFASVNSNAGTAGQPETYPRATIKINVTDQKLHTLTVFSPGNSKKGAKERFTLRSLSKPTAAANVEFDGSQGGAILQFQFIDSVSLTVEQTVGGMGSSEPGANCAALFLD